MLIEQRRYLEDHIEVPFWGKTVPLKTEMNLTLSHHIIKHHEIRVRMWRIREDPISTTTKRRFFWTRKKAIDDHQEVTKKIKLSTKKARELRIFLLRLHAERECLKRILTNIASKNITVSPRSKASDTLQNYLNSATRTIFRMQPQAESEIGEIAREAEDFIAPGERDAIMSALQNFDIRKNVYNKVEHFVNQYVFQENIIMGDQYIVGQAGAVGPQSQAHNMTFSQIWSQIENSIDLSRLADELSNLRQALKNESTNGAKVVEHLKSAGKWALDIAVKIGTNIAAEAIKGSIGLKAQA